MRRYGIAVIPGDGIGKEVMAAGLEVLMELQRRDGGFELDMQQFPWGSDYFRQHGQLMPDDGVARPACSTPSCSGPSETRSSPITSRFGVYG